jgi:MYXO-CTERM domain-containing protein
LGAVALVGCVEDVSVEGRGGELGAKPAISAVPAPIPAAHCSVDVMGVGTLDVETEYLPQVIFCENNGANFEALKAQAIAARSVAYYNMETEGSICDSQGCQVFTCNGVADDIHRQAVEETSGVYLMYNSTLTYGFYVAGDDSLIAPECLGDDADASTEMYVTYNEGRSGDDVEQTSLGLVIPPGDPSYGQNRGCMSQWGSRCLENEAGYDALSILRFYYGQDIQLVQAQGPCIKEVDGPIGGESTTGGDPSTSTSTSSMSDSGPDGMSTGEQGSAVTSDGVEGTGWDGSGSGPSALPTTYGISSAPDGCACRLDRRPTRRLSPWVLGLLLGALASRRRRRN